jgi:hypothetical protein
MTLLFTSIKIDFNGIYFLIDMFHYSLCNYVVSHRIPQYPHLVPNVFVTRGLAQIGQSHCYILSKPGPLVLIDTHSEGLFCSDVDQKQVRVIIG